MDWRTMFLSPEGRMNQKDYWIAVAILFAAWLLSLALHVLSSVIWVLMIYPWICVCAKRLHDGGRSGWLTLVPFIIDLIAFILAVLFAGASMMGAVWTMATVGTSPAAWATLFTALWVMFAFMGAAFLIKLAFIFWVGLSRGDAGDNRYGPPPLSLMTPAPPPSPPAAI